MKTKSRISFLYGISPSLILHSIFILFFFLMGVSQVKKIRKLSEEIPVIQVDLSSVKIKHVSAIPNLEKEKSKKETVVKKKVKEIPLKQEKKETKKSKKVKKAKQKKGKEKTKKKVKKPAVSRPTVAKRIEKGEHKVTSSDQVKKTSLHDLSLSVKDALRVRIRQCWNLDPTRKYPPNLTFQVTAYLGPDGSVFRTLAHSVAGDPMTAHLNASAIRAIEMCAPYTFLPPEQYEEWKEIEITFDPATKNIK